MCLLLREQCSRQQGVLGNWSESKGEEIFRIYRMADWGFFPELNCPRPRWRKVSGVTSQPGLISTAVAMPSRSAPAPSRLQHQTCRCSLPTHLCNCLDSLPRGKENPTSDHKKKRMRAGVKMNEGAGWLHSSAESRIMQRLK